MKNRLNFKVWVTLFCVSIIIGMGMLPLQAASEESESKQNGDNKNSIFFDHDTISSSRPFQAHIILTGSGRYSSRSTNPGAAIHLGYQFSELMHLGWTSQVFYNDDTFNNNDDNKRYDDETVFGQEGANETTVSTDPRHLLEMRFFPWRFGLYFSAGLMHIGYEKAVTEFKSRPRIINENEYDTGLTTTLEYEAWTGVATGVGYNFLFNNGFSLTSGVNIGLTVQKPATSRKFRSCFM